MFVIIWLALLIGLVLGFLIAPFVVISKAMEKWGEGNRAEVVGATSIVLGILGVVAGPYIAAISGVSDATSAALIIWGTIGLAFFGPIIVGIYKYKSEQETESVQEKGGLSKKKSKIPSDDSGRDRLSEKEDSGYDYPFKTKDGIIVRNVLGGVCVFITIGLFIGGVILAIFGRPVVAFGVFIVGFILSIVGILLRKKPTPNHTTHEEKKSSEVTGTLGTVKGSLKTILTPLIPGIGQFYNGQFKKGVIFSLLPFLVGLTNRIHGHMLWVIVFFWGFWIYNLYDFFNTNRNSSGGMGNSETSWSELGLGRKALSIVLGIFSFLIVIAFLQITFSQI